MKVKQEKQNFNYDRQTRQLSDLQAGENVRMQRGEIWKSAVVLHKYEQPRSFAVHIPNVTVYRRSRRDRSKAGEKTFPSTNEQDKEINTDLRRRDFHKGDNKQTAHSHSSAHTAITQQKGHT